MDDAVETLILFFFAALWTSEESQSLRDFLTVEILFPVALIASIGWYKWMRNAPPAPRVEDEAE